MFLAIYGAGGLGREIYDIASRCNVMSRRWSEIIFIDDFHVDGVFLNTRRIQFESLKSKKDSCECLVGIGEPSSREKLFEKLVAEDFKLATLIDPTAIVSPSAVIEKGSVICEFATLHAGATLGCNVLVQPFSNVAHDVKIGQHSVLSSYCSPGGGIMIGERVYIGMHATLKENLAVGSDAIVGMGSVVYQDVPAKATILGNPARVTRGNEEHRVFRQNSPADGNR